jgi:AcrR family transcriptional regulator
MSALADTATSSVQPEGLRARNRDRTRQALAEAAVELFARQGFSATTVEQITELAGVSPRTFFRYFESKDDVLLPLDNPIPAAELIRQQPPEMSDLAAIRAMYLESAPLYELMADRLRALQQAMASSAALRGRSFDRQREAETGIAEALAARRGLEQPDDAAILAAAIGFAVLKTSVDDWLLKPGSRLVPVLEATFARLQVTVAALPADVPIDLSGDTA